MADEEDDYLSDKFLLESAPLSAPRTYAERRKEAQRAAALRNEQNRKKSKRQLEVESREEGLSKSLFERARDDEAASGQQSKALAMMMKMGFKPGESLGQKYDDTPSASGSTPKETDISELAPVSRPSPKIQHITEPLPLSEWAGRKGIGSGKRPPSPSASERLAKMAKMAEATDHATFRDRTRQEYEERRAQGRLAPAQRTCANLDEKAGRKFNVLWLNPDNVDSFPEGLIDALDDPSLIAALLRQRAGDGIEGQMRSRMRADALHPLKTSLNDDDLPATDTEKPDLSSLAYSEEEIEEAAQFLQLKASHDKLQLLLDYLRQTYAYCFWCGTEYDDQEDMSQNCPGPDEDAHD
ncbi:uncharacterized protein FIBRA_03757 [Fibroporia radiculosa]|uniref:DUF4187 domain-containing protein n=1 Tax=Fibroporia radiculosa TaxID=599839 RepID=J4G6A1_9APHY|nr:uncharacterized protein FIBRA_03757 [Fibroporia radiculosa]CCM01693.1 predicted protein [Fibroporia radiculosa]